MKKVGIWIDKEKAHIVTLTEATDKFETIFSNIENYHVAGGSGTRFKGGPQDVVQDSKYLEREKHQFKAYFKDIVAEIKEANMIVIYGPAQTGEKLVKEVNEQYKDLSYKIKAQLTADNMTDNQFRALVKDFFKNYR